MDDNWHRIEIGVPQGSVLGPLFFLLYINDIPKCITGADITLFADDTSVLLGDGSLEKLKAKAEKCLNWMNGLKVTNLHSVLKRHSSLSITLKENKYILSMTIYE